MQPHSRALALAFLLAPLAGAQSLSHVRVAAADAQALAATLESGGFDVIEGSVRANALELVVSERSAALLVARGLPGAWRLAAPSEPGLVLTDDHCPIEALQRRSLGLGQRRGAPEG